VNNIILWLARAIYLGVILVWGRFVLVSGDAAAVPLGHCALGGVSEAGSQHWQHSISLGHDLGERD